MNYFENIISTVKTALQEDIGSGDLTASLLGETSTTSAYIIAREDAAICGRPWVDKVFELIDSDIKIRWLVNEGELVSKGDRILEAQGRTQNLLSAERTALNFIQTLSATATQTHKFCKFVAHTNVKLLDTRKTIPGLRLAQKYAVKIGGGYNHRMGLHDAFLIKENHIKATNSLVEITKRAREISPESRLEIEVENLKELKLALNCKPDWIMLDNFSLEDIQFAVKETNDSVKLEASGGIETPARLIDIAETGVDYISVGALTKNCRAIDFSMLFE